MSTHLNFSMVGEPVCAPLTPRKTPALPGLPPQKINNEKIAYTLPGYIFAINSPTNSR
jgi:hypothetical protein